MLEKYYGLLGELCIVLCSELHLVRFFILSCKSLSKAKLETLINITN